MIPTNDHINEKEKDNNLENVTAAFYFRSFTIALKIYLY